MATVIIIRGKWLPGLYHSPHARRNTKDSKVPSHLTRPAHDRKKVLSLSLFCKQGNRGSASVSNFQGHTVGKWQSQDAHQCLPSGVMGSTENTRACQAAKPGVGTGSLCVCVFVCVYTPGWKRGAASSRSSVDTQ